MRRYLLFIIAPLISASNLSAQIASYHIDFHAGTGFLKATKHHDFRELWGTGYNLGGDLTYELSELFAAGIYAGYNRFAVDRAAAANMALDMGAQDLLESSDISLITLNMLLRFKFYSARNKSDAYLLFQFGWTWPNGAFVGAIKDSSNFLVAMPFPKEREETISFGAGIDRKISKNTGLFVELTYRIIYLRWTELYLDYPRPITEWPETHHADFFRLAVGMRYSLKY